MRCMDGDQWPTIEHWGSHSVLGAFWAAQPLETGCIAWTRKGMGRQKQLMPTSLLEGVIWDYGQLGIWDCGSRNEDSDPSPSYSCITRRRILKRAKRRGEHCSICQSDWYCEEVLQAYSSSTRIPDQGATGLHCRSACCWEKFHDLQMNFSCQATDKPTTWLNLFLKRGFSRHWAQALQELVHICLLDQPLHATIWQYLMSSYSIRLDSQPYQVETSLSEIIFPILIAE